MKYIIKPICLLLTLSLALTLTACGNNLEAENTALKQELSALMDENAVLKAEIAALERQLEQWNQEVGLTDFGAQYTPWADSAGASVTVTAVPAAYEEGQSADLVVWLQGEETEKMPFHWDGSAYTATVELPAADGYTFLCLLKHPDGRETQVVLDNPEMDPLVYLESNLTAFLTLFVSDWTAADGELRIHAGYAQAQLPRLVPVSIQETRLVLSLNGQEAEAQTITLSPGADEGSFEHLLSGIRFPLPEMTGDSQLDLLLEVTLSDGRLLSVSGGSWFYTNGELLMAVG